MASDIRRWREDLQGEVDGVAIYQAMATGESEPALAAVYGKLAATEARHASV